MEMGSETISKVHDSRLYKSLLPLVGPLTEPAVKRILESPTFQVRVWSTFSIKPSLLSCQDITSTWIQSCSCAAMRCACHWCCRRRCCCWPCGGRVSSVRVLC